MNITSLLQSPTSLTVLGYMLHGVWFAIWYVNYSVFIILIFFFDQNAMQGPEKFGMERKLVSVFSVWLNIESSTLSHYTQTIATQKKTCRKHLLLTWHSVSLKRRNFPIRKNYKKSLSKALNIIYNLTKDKL